MVFVYMELKTESSKNFIQLKLQIGNPKLHPTFNVGLHMPVASLLYPQQN